MEISESGFNYISLRVKFQTALISGEEKAALLRIII
jgi:hypothetical protein